MSSLMRRHRWLKRLVLCWCALAFGGSLVRSDCPMHRAASQGVGHMAHGTGEHPMTSQHSGGDHDPCSCVGDCTTPVGVRLGDVPLVPMARVVLVAHHVPSAWAGVDAARTQTRLPFSNGPPAA